MLKRIQCVFSIRLCTFRVFFISNWCSPLNCNKCFTFLDKNRTTIIKQKYFLTFFDFVKFDFVFLNIFSSWLSLIDFHHNELTRHKTTWPGYEFTFFKFKLRLSFSDFVWPFFSLSLINFNEGGFTYWRWIYIYSEAANEWYSGK